MNILVIGGTRFAGRHFVELAARGPHAVTVFHRGSTAMPLPNGAREALGDRDSDAIEAIAGARWDGVLDMCGYRPEVVERSARAFARGERPPRYLFVSSVSAYASFKDAGLDEDAELAALPPDVEKPDAMEYYGPLKAACERVVVDAFGPRATIVRPGLIVGPYDPTDRFTYWVERLQRGGDVLAPGRPERLVQFIDARDLAAFMLGLFERDLGGAFNATGPTEPMTMVQMLETGAAELARGRVTLRWLPDDVVLQAGVEPWMGLPLWLPDALGDKLLEVDISRAVRAGLRTRPVAETFADTAAWVATLANDRERKAGITAEQEQVVLG